METAQYNITNNRLFFWPEEGTRLPDEEFNACKAAGFTWWPRGCFTCTWRPAAEDWILARGVEIVADDTPDDVESRVERFSGYASKAEAEAGYASARASSATTDRRFEMASRSALREAEQAVYWQRRIDGAIARIERHDNPATCANRIKGLGADLRRFQKSQADSRKFIEYWQTLVTDQKSARKVAGADRLTYWEQDGTKQCFADRIESGVLPWADAQAIAISAHERQCAYFQRWIDHLNMQIQYESAYLIALGGGALLEPQKRKVTPAPQDGLKKGIVVEFTTYIGGATRTLTGPILSLGPKVIKVKLPDEFNRNGYWDKGWDVARKNAKAVQADGR